MMKTRFLTLAVLVAIPVLAIATKLCATNPNCDGTIPSAAHACLTGDQSCGKYADQGTCEGGIGLYKIQTLVVSTHADPTQGKCKTTLAAADPVQAVCADQYYCDWTGGDYPYCTQGVPVLDRNNQPCHTTVTVYTAASCNAVGCGA
jgi:hypothetical protein